jgi:hypothetical protein
VAPLHAPGGLMNRKSMLPYAPLPEPNDDNAGGAGGADDGDEGGGADTGTMTLEQALSALGLARKDAAKYRTQARALKPLADKARELEDRDKTEAQKATDKAAAAEARALEAETRALRLEIAHEKGLTPAQAKRLMGGTKEELEADADELLSTFGSKSTDDGKPPVGRRPAEALRPGGGTDPEDGLDLTDPDKLAALVPRGYAF